MLVEFRLRSPDLQMHLYRSVFAIFKLYTTPHLVYPRPPPPPPKKRKKNGITIFFDFSWDDL